MTPRRRTAIHWVLSGAACFGLAVEAAGSPHPRIELSRLLATEAYGLAGSAAFSIWRFARHRWAVAPGVLALFATFVSVDYVLIEDRVAGHRVGVVLALCSAVTWAYFRFAPRAAWENAGAKPYLGQPDTSASATPPGSAG